MTIIETAWGDAVIEISREPEAAQAVSDYLRSLPLTVEQNNHLIGLLIACIQAAEKNAFAQGLGMVLGAAEKRKRNGLTAP